MQLARSRPAVGMWSGREAACFCFMLALGSIRGASRKGAREQGSWDRVYPLKTCLTLPRDQGRSQSKGRMLEAGLGGCVLWEEPTDLMGEARGQEDFPLG